MIVFKYLDESAALETLKNECVLFRCPEQYKDHTDSLVFSTQEEKNKAFRLYLNYLMFKNLHEELVQNKSKPMKLRNIAKPFLFAINQSIKLIRETKRYTYQIYLNAFNKFIYNYLNKKEKDLKIEFNKAINDSYEKIRNDALVSCFCKSCEERIMWDRYAGGYKGICVGFEFDETIIREVKYVKEPVSFNLYKAFELHFGHEIANVIADYNDKKFEFLNDPFFCKDKVYEDEKEMRCLFSRKKIDDRFSPISINGDEAFLFKTSGIKQIIITDRTCDRVIQLIKEKFKNLNIGKIIRKNGSYELKAIEVEEI